MQQRNRRKRTTYFRIIFLIKAVCFSGVCGSWRQQFGCSFLAVRRPTGPALSSQGPSAAFASIRANRITSCITRVFSHSTLDLSMQSLIPNDGEIPADFPRPGQDRRTNFLRWQECVIAAGHIANMCFEAKSDAAPGSNHELLARSVFLVCGQNLTDEETRWVVRYSSAQLGW